MSEPHSSDSSGLQLLRFRGIIFATLQRIALSAACIQMYSCSPVRRRRFSDLIRTAAGLLARMYARISARRIRCNERLLATRDASFAGPVSRNSIKENPANYGKVEGGGGKGRRLHAAPVFLPRCPTARLRARGEDFSRTKFQRLRLLPPEIIRSLSSHFSSAASEKRGKKGRAGMSGRVARRGENGDNSGWPGRLRSFRALTRLIAGPRIRALRSTAESVYFKRHRARVTLASGALSRFGLCQAATRRV